MANNYYSTCATPNATCVASTSDTPMFTVFDRTMIIIMYCARIAVRAENQ